MTKETVESRTLDILCDLVASDVSQRAYPDFVRAFILDRKRAKRVEQVCLQYDTADAVDTVDENNALEELCLRRLDQMEGQNQDLIDSWLNNHGKRPDSLPHDPRKLAIARTNLEQAFKWLRSATAQPDRLNHATTDLLHHVTAALAKGDPSVSDPVRDSLAYHLAALYGFTVQDAGKEGVTLTDERSGRQAGGISRDVIDRKDRVEIESAIRSMRDYFTQNIGRR